MRIRSQVDGMEGGPGVGGGYHHCCIFQIFDYAELNAHSGGLALTVFLQSR